MKDSPSRSRHDERGVLGRDATRIGFVVACLAGVAVATAWITFGGSFPLENDARIFHRVAMDPFGDGSSFAGLPSDTGTGYRYGRILYPLTAWVLAFGRPSLVAYSMAVVYAVSVGAMAALACRLCGEAGVPETRGLWVLAAPSFWLTVPVLFSEPFTVALLLLTYRLFLRGRERGTLVAGAALLLTREAMAVALVPLVWASHKRSGLAGAARWAWTAVPLAAWWTWVRARVGVWPFLDPAYGRRGALSWIIGGPITVAREGVRHPGLFVLACVLLGASLVAAVVVVRRRRSPVAWGALVLAVLALFLGPGAWRIPGEAIRLLLPAQAMTIVALLARSRRAHGMEAAP